MIKNVLSFCINEQSYQTPLEICIGLRNRISLYNFFLHPDQLQNTRDIALNNENPQSIALDATTICAALVSPDMKTGIVFFFVIRKCLRSIAIAVQWNLHNPTPVWIWTLCRIREFKRYVTLQGG